MSRWWPCFAVVALSCGKDKDTTTETPTEGDADTDADTDSDTDADADADTDADTDADVTGDAARGETLFSSCAGCHGADGTGGFDIGGTLSADLTVRVPALTDEELSNIIKDGYGTAMPSQYTDAQDIADVIAYLRVTFP